MAAQAAAAPARVVHIKLFYSPTLCQSFKLRQGVTILITYIVGPEPGSQAGELRLALALQ